MGKILFIRGGAVGDFILTLPAVRLVREHLPENEIEILGYPAITSLAVVSGLADRTRSIEDAKLAAFFAPGASLDEEWCDYFSSFDLVVSYLYDPDQFFSNNLKAAGVKSLLTGPFKPHEDEPWQPAAVQLAKPLEHLALFLDDPEMVLSYPQNGDFNLEISETSPPAIIHPGSGSPRKNWSLERWAEVVDKLSQQRGLTWLVSSGEAEHETIGDFTQMLEVREVPFRHLGDRSLPELGFLFSKTAFYLGHDSGISHLAASAGAGGLLLFGPTRPEVWAPVSKQMKSLVGSNQTLGAISVEQVMESVPPTSFSQARRR
ncbi:MAG: glycosyltransferase family 9 protein [Verrucomicrobiota bacterium]